MITSIHRVYLNLAKQIFLIGFATVTVMAQQDRGTILGIVQDTSEAVIAGATVVVRNQETGKEMKLTTDSSGLFVAPELPVGTYQVTVSLQGFKTKIQDGII